MSVSIINENGGSFLRKADESEIDARIVNCICKENLIIC